MRLSGRGLLRAVAGWIGLSILGGLIIAVPDSDNRVFSFSETHGPSVLDVIGMILLGLGYAWFVAALMVRWREFQSVERHIVAGAAAGFVAGIFLVAWSVTTDTGAWWALGALLAAASQWWFAWNVATRPEREGPHA